MVNKMISIFRPKKIKDFNPSGLNIYTFNAGFKKKDKDLLRRLHVKEGNKIIEGAEAFLYVWKKIPKYKFLYKFFKLPIIFTIFKYGYEIIAFFLYLKNKKQLKS